MSRAIEVLIIDDGRGLPRRVSAALQQASVAARATTVDGVLMALGEASRPVASPPGVLVAPMVKLNGQAPAIAEALHQIAPGLRLIAVAEEESAGAAPTSPACAEAAKQAGFTCVNEPVSAATWAELVAADARSQRDDELEQGAPSPQSSFPQEGAGDGGPASDEVLHRLPPLEVLEQLLHPHGQPREAALTLIRQQAGLGQSQWFADEAAAPPGNTHLALARLGQSFGVLSAPASVSPAQLAPWANWLTQVLALHQQQRDLWFMAMRDELTGAWNRRYFHRYLHAVLRQAQRESKSVTVLLFDIDDFKRYNDRYGHEAGDEILRQTVQLMRAVVREPDVVARIGGDEFAVVFFDHDSPRRANSQHPSDLLKITDRFRRALSTHRFAKLGAQAVGSLTVSGGLATYPRDGQTPAELVARADAMAMQAKREGKNAIRFGVTDSDRGNR